MQRTLMVPAWETAISRASICSLSMRCAVCAVQQLSESWNACSSSRTSLSAVTWRYLCERMTRWGRWGQGGIGRGTSSRCVSDPDHRVKGDEVGTTTLTTLERNWQCAISVAVF